MTKEMETMINNVYTNMNNIFLDDDSKGTVAVVNQEDINETFFTAELIALQVQFETLTGQEVDMIDFIHILNKLAVQYLLENGKVEE